MRFAVHVRADLKERLNALASEMSAWDGAARVSEAETQQIRERIEFFEHTAHRPGLTLAGVDGSGDYPALSYGDSFVYVTVAQGTLYTSDPHSGLRELPCPGTELLDFCWIPEDEVQRFESINGAFTRMVGQPIEDVIAASDYAQLKERHARRKSSVSELAAELIRPHAADTGNLAIQLRSVGELSSALKLIRSHEAPRYVLLDSTMTLPFVSRAKNSLFQEHLKRLCCVEARHRGIGFLALSKSHGLPSIELIETLADEAAGQRSTEHWYLRLPRPGQDDWQLSLLKDRTVPPHGAVSYLVRFHRNVPVMRLDLDQHFWESHLRGATDAETRLNEQRLFEDLDHASHDQRAYGYPYPIKAGHDRASMTEAERVALRKMIIDAAVAAGMRRANFKNASAATGHA